MRVHFGPDDHFHYEFRGLDVGRRFPGERITLRAAEAIFWEEYENHRVRGHIHEARERYQRALEVNGPAAEIEHYRRQIEELTQHYYLHHGRGGGAGGVATFGGAGTVNVWGAGGGGGGGATVGPQMTATKVRQRQAEQMAELARRMPPAAWANFNLDHMVNIAVYGGGGGGVEVAGAAKRGMDLLKANLTPKQKEDLEARKYFDVTGGGSGKTYRITKGTHLNVYLLDKDGVTSRIKLCFLPQGGLVEGDCMLAQKMTLELQEQEALKIANQFPGSYAWDGSGNLLAYSHYGDERMMAGVGGPGFIRGDLFMWAILIPGIVVTMGRLLGFLG